MLPDLDRRDAWEVASLEAGDGIAAVSGRYRPGAANGHFVEYIVPVAGLIPHGHILVRRRDVVADGVLGPNGAEHPHDQFDDPVTEVE